MYLSDTDYIYKKKEIKKMNAAEIKTYVENVAGESADTQVDDYLSDGEDFVLLDETDSDLKRIMENKSIKDKVGAFAEVLWNDEGFLMDHLGDCIYQINDDIIKKKVLKGLSKVVPHSHDVWHNVLVKIEKDNYGDL